MLNKRVFEIGAGRSALSDGKLYERDFFHDLPDVPVLPETLLSVELKLHEPQVNLTELTGLVLGDLGAALQIYRMAQREYGSLEDRPTRIEDCISDLGLWICLDVISRQTVTRGSRQNAVLEYWAHARGIADYCSLVAEEASPETNPRDAYLVGLFHELGLLPDVLGWSRSVYSAADSSVAGMRMAIAWSLPRCVREYFCEIQLPGPMNRWLAIVETAHHLACMPTH